MNWKSWLDEYDREARLVPALLTILPLVLVTIGLGVEDNLVLVTTVAVLVSIGLPVLVAKQVGEQGRAMEAELFARWGAPPTTLKLLPPTHGIGETLRQRRLRLEQATGITLPISSSLTATDADAYNTAVRWLIEHTRDHAKFPVVWTELKSYGFERNMLGLRHIARITSGIGALALTGGAVAALGGAHLSAGTNTLLAGVCVLIGIGWTYVPTERRVRAAADRYAERLLDALVLVP